MSGRILRRLCTMAAIGIGVGVLSGCEEDMTGAGSGAGCNVNGTGTVNDTRFHVVNNSNVGKIRTVLTIGSDTCVIDPLPTADVGEDLELGQWLKRNVGVGTTVVADVSVQGGPVTTLACTVTEEAILPPDAPSNALQTFIEVFATASEITLVACGAGFN